ncbi:Putative NAD(P)H-dependent FMN-containing oxidoreductase YwqN [Streptomyces tendae]
MTRRFLFLPGSTRPDGNTELLARRAAEQLPAGVEQHWIDLARHPLPEFEDLRHDSDHTRPTEGNARLLLDATLAATDIVIASPLYWYTLSTPVKRYLDHWSGWLRTRLSTSRRPWPAAPCGASPRSPTRSGRSRTC